jgi:hypothetical protein
MIKIKYIIFINYYKIVLLKKYIKNNIIDDYLQRDLPKN